MKRVIVVFLVVLFMIMFLVPPANARNGRNACLMGACIGGIFGWLFGRHVDIEPPYPPPPPAMCYREIPGYWLLERQFPGSPPERVWIRTRLVRVPCP